MLKWFYTFNLLLGAVNRLLFAISADQLLLLTCVIVITMSFTNHVILWGDFVSGPAQLQQTHPATPDSFVRNMQ